MKKEKFLCSSITDLVVRVVYRPGKIPRRIMRNGDQELFIDGSWIDIEFAYMMKDRISIRCRDKKKREKVMPTYDSAPVDMDMEYGYNGYDTECKFGRTNRLGVDEGMYDEAVGPVLCY